MITRNMTKFVVAVALTLAITFGSGIVADELGLPTNSHVYACIHTGGSGGGC